MNIRTINLSLLLILGLLTATSAEQLKPTEIIYSRTVTNMNAPPVGANQPTIWAVGQDGSNDRFITNGTMPRISDDGRFLLFKSFTRHPSYYDPFGGYADLVIRNLASGQETVIQEMSFNNDQLGYSFSPESNEGSYEIIFDRNCFMFRMNRDGTSPLQFPWDNSDFCYDDFPVVRRGDQMIAFSSFPAFPANVGGLYTMTITGSSRQRIPNTTCHDIHPAWSNDNQFIAFGTTFYTNCGPSIPLSPYYPYFVSNLVKIKPDGTGRQQLTNYPANPDCSQTGANCFTFGYVWTGDNSKVIAAGRINGIKGLFAFNSNGSGAFSQIAISPGNAPDFVGGIVQPRVEQNVVSIGGGVATGGTYSLVSTIGEAIAGITSTGGSYSFESGFWALPTAVKKSPFDFDGDGKTDIGIFRPVGAASEWWINRSSTGVTFALQFGASTDRIAPADFTGDGKTDIAFFRPASGEWYVLRSEDFSFFALPFGTNGDVPVPADYDADGKADFAVFRPSSSTWFISQSSGAPTRIYQFGINGDQPVASDYDGDGKADVGIFRVAQGQWWIDRSTAGLLAVQFGNSTDKPVQGDYTGDGKTDIAIWRLSTGEWFIVRSEDFSFYGFPFGTTGDVPSPGDYDGDGRFDPTVFRPSSATWFIARTTAGTQIVQFGANGDRPIPNAFVP